MPKRMYVVFCENDGTYWCGLNTWDKQLRKAKVFHSLKYANEVHRRYKELKLKNVEIRMELVTDTPTNADSIRAMSDEELVNIVPCPLGFSMFRCPKERQCGPCKKEWLQQPAGGEP